MRILHFVSTLSYESGVMSVIMNYYRNINTSMIQFDFLYFIKSQNSYEKEINALGGKTYFIEKPGIKSINTFKEFFKQHMGEYKWFHNHEVYLTFFLRPLSKRYGIKNFIVHCHATKYSDKFISSIRNAILCFPIKFMDINRVACSELAGNFLYGTNKKFFVVRNAIDIEKFSYCEQERMRIRDKLLINDKLVIGHIGRFEKQKNHKFIIKIFKSILDENKNAILILIGEGHLKSEVERIVNHYGISENVIFIGRTEKIKEFLSAFDVFILPSIYEGFPVSAIEAQANGLRCFLSDKITEEAVLSKNIIRLPIKNEILWSKEIIKYKNSYKHENISDRLKKEFDIKITVKKLEHFYNGFIEN